MKHREAEEISAKKEDAKEMAGGIEETSASDLSPAVTFPFLPGVYLAVNAIRDARIVIEGPDCTYMKTQYVQGNHDMMATLTSVSGWHKVVNTALYPSSVIASREEPLRRLLEKVASHPSTGGTLLTSMPMASITGADYEGVCAEVAERTGKDVISVRGLSLRGDWLDGYAEVLRALARNLRLPEPPGQRNPRRVAMVGYLRDRNEADHEANLLELRELLGAIGLELCSTWLDGSPMEDLRRVAEAGTILSLPYGRMAARILARRTGAELIELPLPLGLEACEHWAVRLGEAFGAEKEARRYVGDHLARIGPRLEWLVPTVLQNLNVGYAGDPHMLPGIASTIELVGARLRFALITNRVAHTRELGKLSERVPMLIRPRQAKLSRVQSEQWSKNPLHLMIANSAGVSAVGEGTALLELGFPTIYTRAVFEKPFLGFRGTLALIGDMVNAVRMHEVYRYRSLEQKGGE